MELQSCSPCCRSTSSSSGDHAPFLTTPCRSPPPRRCGGILARVRAPPAATAIINRAGLDWWWAGARDARWIYKKLVVRPHFVRGFVNTKRLNTTISVHVQKRTEASSYAAAAIAILPRESERPSLTDNDGEFTSVDFVGYSCSTGLPSRRCPVMRTARTHATRTHTGALPHCRQRSRRGGADTWP
jgi:hypothetical protein